MTEPLITPKTFVELCKQLRELGATHVAVGVFAVNFGPPAGGNVQPREPPARERTKTGLTADEQEFVRRLEQLSRAGGGS